jgi:hypothetical protein
MQVLNYNGSFWFTGFGFSYFCYGLFGDARFPLRTAMA